MKKTILVATSLCISLILNAQISKTITINAGELASAISASERNTITSLTLTGNIDARDFKTMRDSMKVLAALDLSEANISAYTGVLGTWFTTESIDYPANTIPNCAFYFVAGKDNGKASLKTVKIPVSTIGIGKHSFRGCTGLTSFSLPPSVNQIGIYAFFSCINLAQIELPASVTAIEDFAFYNCQGFSTFPLTSSIKSIGESAFYNCGYVTTLTIPSSVTSIGKNAFQDCFSLTSISIPSSVTSIGDNAFEGCQSLTSAVIPSSMTSISNYVFYGCGKLKSVTIPSSVKSIGKYAFNYCGSLTSLTIPTSVTSIDDGAFYESGLTSITIPSSVTFLGQAAFGDCSNLTSVSIPSSITSISNNTFLRCENLASITLPSSVTSIGLSAFEGCIKLTSVTIPSSVTSLGDCIFNGCSGLTSVTISSSATSLGYRAFGGCYRLTSITIPYSVKSIGAEAFYYCSGLKSIFSYSITPIDLRTSLSVFENVDKTTCTLYVPEGSKSAYQAANQWKDFLNIVEMPAIVLSSNIVNFGATQNKTSSISITSYTNWTASSDQSWLKVSPISSSGNQTLTIIADSNPLPTSRTATITITPVDASLKNASTTENAMGSNSITSGNTQTITITQEANTTNNAPIANAGPDQSVFEGITVSLDGSTSSDPDGTQLSFKWTAPSVISLNSETTAKPTFIAPEVTQDETYTFSLVVNDGAIDSPVDQVVITVKNVNKAPIANAGSDQSVNEGTTVSLDGLASSDPDGTQLSYKWTAPSGINLNSESAAKPTFIVPEVMRDTAFTFLLVVNDGKVDSEVDQVVISVKNVNKTPVANAGKDMTVKEGTAVSLDGSSSYDPDGEPIFYQWKAPAGITISSETEAKPTFIAPEVKNDSTIIILLEVSDGIVNSIPVTINLTILNVIKDGVSIQNNPFFKLYPNPTNGIINIELIGETDKKPELTVMSLVGTVIYKKEITDACKFQIDLSNQIRGVYLLKISSNDNQYVRKIEVK
jgi:hypothetical protein